MACTGKLVCLFIAIAPSLEVAGEVCMDSHKLGFEGCSVVFSLRLSVCFFLAYVTVDVLEQDCTT
jgi:hypothetical protein